MQRYTQADTMLLTADERSLALAGLMVPDALITALKGQSGQGLELSVSAPSARSQFRSAAIGASPTRHMTSAKSEMRGGALGGHPLRSQ